MKCGLRSVLRESGQSETVIVISGEQSLDNDHGGQSDLGNMVDQQNIPVFLLLWPESGQGNMSAGSRGAEHGDLTRNGGELLSVIENNEEVHPGKLVQSYLETILNRVDRVHTRTLVYTHHHVQRSGQLTGQFSLDPTQGDTLGSASSLRVTLTLPDEEKVELFEIESPNGSRKILSKFEDGMVYFSLTGVLEPGLWKYRAKIYPDTILQPEDLITVDAVLSQVEGAAEEDHRVVTSVSWSQMLPDSWPLTLAVRVHRGERPVMGAVVSCKALSQDGASQSVNMLDNGLGYPDITSGDGVYTGYLAKPPLTPGYIGVVCEVISGANTRIGSGNDLTIINKHTLNSCTLNLISTRNLISCILSC